MRRLYAWILSRIFRRTTRRLPATNRRNGRVVLSLMALEDREAASSGLGDLAALLGGSLGGAINPLADFGPPAQVSSPVTGAATYNDLPATFLPAADDATAALNTEQTHREYPSDEYVRRAEARPADDSYLFSYAAPDWSELPEIPTAPTQLPDLPLPASAGGGGGGGGSSAENNPSAWIGRGGADNQ